MFTAGLGIARSAARFVTALSIVPAALADVRIVDDSGNGDFTEIQAAVDAAVDGDVLIVREGTYHGFTIVDESLDVLAEDGTIVRIDGSVSVLDLGHGKQVALHGLVVSAKSQAKAALELADDLGSVRVSSCVLRGWDTTDHYGEWPTEGARVRRSPDVSFDACTLEGGNGGQWGDCTDGLDGATALFLVESRVAISRSTLTGGNGGNGGDVSDECFWCGYSWAGTGADAATVADHSFLFVGASTLVGGDGAIGYNCKFGGWDMCGFGGNGLGVLHSSSVAKVLDCVLAGGVGGGGCPRGMPADGPNIEFLSGAAKQMSMERRLARSGELLTVSFDGAPFDEVALAVSSQPDFHYQALSRGVLLFGGGRRVLLAGFLDANGHWDATIAAQGPAHDDDTMTVHLQGLLKDAAGERTLTNPAQLTVIR